MNVDAHNDFKDKHINSKRYTLQFYLFAWKT